MNCGRERQTPPSHQIREAVHRSDVCKVDQLVAGAPDSDVLCGTNSPEAGLTTGSLSALDSPDSGQRSGETL